MDDTTFQQYDADSYNEQAGDASAEEHFRQYQSSRLVESLQCIRDARASMLLQARSYEEEFVARRKEAWRSFTNLNFKVRARQEDRSIQILWVRYHLDKGKPVMSQELKKPKGCEYDLGVIKRACPEWLHEIACEMELKARPLRYAFARYTNLERELRFIDTNVFPGQLFPQSRGAADPGAASDDFEDHE